MSFSFANVCFLFYFCIFKHCLYKYMQSGYYFLRLFLCCCVGKRTNERMKENITFCSWRVLWEKFNLFFEWFFLILKIRILFFKDMVCLILPGYWWIILFNFYFFVKGEIFWILNGGFERKKCVLCCGVPTLK